MNSPELLRLVENCPTGAETLVTRVLHIVTDKSMLIDNICLKEGCRFIVMSNEITNNLELTCIQIVPSLFRALARAVKKLFPPTWNF